MTLRSNILHAIGQRLYYIKNYRKGFSLVFLLPGSIREKLGENKFFSTLTAGNGSISIEKNDAGQTILRAGEFNFKFPKRCFYEGDFFDIVYPHLHLHDDLIETLVYKNPYYESEGLYENFGAVLREGDNVIDAGANVGMFSVVASKKIGDGGKVFAFEPLKEISAYLEENIRNNGRKNVVVENVLLGDAEKDVEFFHNLERNFNAASKKFKNDGDKVATLRQTTLDSYVKEKGIKKIDFIKADIEGAERDLLAGAEDTIRRFKPRIAIRTYHLPDDPQVLYTMLKKYVPEYKTVQHKKTLYAWIDRGDRGGKDELKSHEDHSPTAI